MRSEQPIDIAEFEEHRGQIRKRRADAGAEARNDGSVAIRFCEAAEAVHPVLTPAESGWLNELYRLGKGHGLFERLVVEQSPREGSVSCRFTDSAGKEVALFEKTTYKGKSSGALDVRGERLGARHGQEKLRELVAKLEDWVYEQAGISRSPVPANGPSVEKDERLHFREPAPEPRDADVIDLATWVSDRQRKTGPGAPVPQ